MGFHCGVALSTFVVCLRLLLLVSQDVHTLALRNIPGTADAWRCRAHHLD